MSQKKEHHLFVASYNRPNLLARTLESLRSQTFQDWHITLAQDGPRSQEEADVISQCIDVFRRAFPRGKVMRQIVNVGVGLNILRAQERAFAELGLETAYFFEDDLVLHSTYVEQLVHLRETLFPFSHYVPYFACYGCLHAYGAGAEHIPNTHLRFIDHSLWAYGLFRDHWVEGQKLLKPYFDYLRTVPYHRRDTGIIQRIFQQLGCPHTISSQDGARMVGLQVLNRCAVTTIPRRATYIGEVGEHSTPSGFSDWGFVKEPLPDEIPLISPCVDEKALEDACSKFPGWVDTLTKLPPNRIAELESSLALKNRRIDELTAQVWKLTEKISLLETSSCWRTTAPLRLVADMLRTACLRLIRKASCTSDFLNGHGCDRHPDALAPRRRNGYPEDGPENGHRTDLRGARR